ncbi:lysozyme family protein [Zymobacter palmae]|uniref:hypothetical protein n=1 Tax=Zymobacter palmae TaxID=33074 RepID=UPI0011AE835A|nr:hypothetical protein [Zymobacter palmae]
MANGYYPSGYFTFHAEGASTNPATNSLHFPKGKSGVTIGPGYDLKTRTKDDVYRDMIAIGVSKEDANIIKEGIGKMHEEAQRFVNENKNKIKKLTKAQKIMLFKIIWNSTYYTGAKSVYKARVPKKVFEKDTKILNKTDSKLFLNKTNWDDLNDKILDIAVDLHYQGALAKNSSLQYAISKNDPLYLADCIEKFPDLVSYDGNRKRIPYLRGTFSGPSDF